MPSSLRKVAEGRMMLATRETLIKSPSEFLSSPMVQDEEEFPAHTEV